MGIIAQKRLFGWEEIEALGELERLGLALKRLPDEKLLRVLAQERGQGRDDYPVVGMWNALVAGVVCQHPSVESLRRELMRNGQLRWMCGLSSVPPSWAFTRFLRKLLKHLDLVEEIFETLVSRLQEALPDLGVYLAHDGKALASHGRSDRRGQKADGRREREANVGVKTHRRVKEDGTVYEKVTTWFGFRVHLLVDAAHELPVARKLTRASEAECPVAHELLDHVKLRHPGILGRCETYSADKEFDDGKLLKRLWDEERIKPVIPIRELWRNPGETRLIGRQRQVAYNQIGEVFCHCPKTGQAHRMAFAGLEAERGSLKYRCPAMQKGISCAGYDRCKLHAGMRIPLEQDRRIFTPLARNTPSWERSYKRRSAVERVNSRLDQSFGFERHFIRGLKKMALRVDLALVTMLAMALGRIEQKQKDKLRSLVQAA
jgi:hypothetical protein